MSFYPATDLVLNAQSEVYHLGLTSANVAKKIIVVGDQDRVELVSSFFDEVNFRKQHREFVCHTGIYKDKNISVLSTGIGTDNIDIVVNELDAIFNIDLSSRTEKVEKTTLEIVRIGTCGILRPEIDVHSYILSSHALGLDNIAHFYKLNFSDFESKVAKELHSCMGLPQTIQPYFVSANKELTARFESEKTHKGITITSSGFYGPQGRNLRLATPISNIHTALETFNYEGLKTMNFEMESSALFALGRGLGHACTTICLGIANRPKFEFSKGYKEEMDSLIQYVLDRF